MCLDKNDFICSIRMSTERAETIIVVIKIVRRKCWAICRCQVCTTSTSVFRYYIYKFNVSIIAQSCRRYVNY